MSDNLTSCRKMLICQETMFSFELIPSVCLFQCICKCIQYQLRVREISLHLSAKIRLFAIAILGSRKHHQLDLLVTKQWVTLRFLWWCY